MKTIYMTLFLIVFNILFLSANENEQKLLNSLYQKQGKEKIDCLNKISKIIREDKPQDAKKYIYDALKLSREIGYYQGEGQALLNLGVTESVLGDNRKAEETFNRALRIYKNHSDILGIIKSKIDLGNVQIIIGDLKNALINLNLAYRLSNENHFNDEIAKSSLNLGLLFEEMNDNNKAIEHFNITVQILNKSNDNKNLARTINMIGILYLKTNKYEKSLENFNKALNYIDTINNLSLAETIYNNIALIYSKKGNKENAINFFCKSLRLAEKIQDSVSIAISYNNLGNEYAEIGNNKIARDYFNSSIKLLSRFDASSDLADALVGRSRFFIKNNLQEYAQSDLLKALDIYNMLDVKDGKKDVYALLSESYILSNKNSFASLYFKQYKNYNDSLFTIERTKSLDISNAKIEAMLEIERLDSALRLEREKLTKLLLIIVSILIFVCIMVVFFLARKKLVNKLNQKENEIYYYKENNENLYDSFGSDVKNRMYILGNFILESNDSKNYELLKSSFDDVSHLISDVLVKYKVDINSN